MKQVVWLGLALPLLLLGCDQGPQSAQEAEAELCANLDRLETSLMALSQIDANSQVSELRTARENVASAYQDVRSSAEDVQVARTEELEAAYNDLDTTVDNISGRETVGEAANAVAAGLSNIRAARTQMDADVMCN
ncbi:MAG: hypothetical protein EA342_16045 [Leptolyngbya sp. LCM1.Bin17]|nr:MAG: hypothetical protein EA342_16045 [Leptolyngbya sp. LCM1.Bin17]